MSTLTFNIFNKKITQDTILGINPEDDFMVLINQCKLNKINFDIKKVRRAFDLCFDVYKEAVYFNQKPRYTHPLSVAMIITKEIPLDETSVIAALLHDIWSEFDKYDYSFIANEFGKEIANIVDGIHKIRDTEESVLNQPEEIDKYRKVLLAMGNDFRVVLVKLADMLENMRNASFKSNEEQQRMAKEAFEIYTPFANRLGLRNMKWELDDLAFKIQNPLDYENINNFLNANKTQREEFINKFANITEERLEKDEFLKRNRVTFELSGRAKHIFSIYNKMHLRKRNIDELFDLFAIRVVLNTPEPNICYYVYGIIASLFPPVPETFKDYIASPKKNGYRSIHTAVYGIDNKIVEVQIRTEEMHYYSESGVAAHFKYKTHLNDNSVLEKAEIQRWMHVVRDIFENPGEENTGQILDEVRSNLFADEIYVYSPTNEFFTLPINSTTLDFAYHIHTDLGNHFVGAKVNGKMQPIDYRLKNGDKVEIIISNKAQPTEDWLSYIVSSKARNNLQKYFKLENKKKEFQGKEIWKNELIKKKVSVEETQLIEYLKDFDINSINDFYFCVAEGEINLTDFVEYIIHKKFERNNEKSNSQESAEEDFTNVLVENKKIVLKHKNEILLSKFSKDVRVYIFSFIAKENYNYIKKISDLILQYSDLIITKFTFNIEINKVTGELIFESDDNVQADSLLTELKTIKGIVQINK